MLSLLFAGLDAFDMVLNIRNDKRGGLHGSWQKAARRHGLLCWGCLGLLVLPAQAQLSAARGSAHSLTMLPVTLAGLDSLNGLGPYKFNTPLLELPGELTHVQTLRSGEISCMAPAEVLAVDSIHLSGLILVLRNGLLIGIHSSATSTERYADALLALVQARYGAGKNIGYQKYRWVGKRVTLVYEPVIVQTSHISRGSSPTINLGSLLLISNDYSARRRNKARNE